MGKKKENPRYNILSCRINDDLRHSVNHALSGISVQDFLHSAIEEKLTNDRQAQIDLLMRERRS